MLYRFLGTTVAVLVFTSYSVSHLKAQQLRELKTPPAALDHLSQQQLNDFGTKIATEAYSVLSKDGAKTTKIGSKPQQEGRQSVKNAKALMDDKILIQNALYNYGITKNTYISTEIDDFFISDMAITRPASNILIASYNIALPNRIDLTTASIMSSEKLPRLTVLRWDERKKQWLIFSHADFDKPISAICGITPTKAVRKSTFKNSDIAIAKQILDAFHRDMLSGNQAWLKTNGQQFVYASGERKTATAPVNVTFQSNPKLKNIEAIKSGALLAVRFDAPGIGLLENDGTVNKSIKPRLHTYYKDHDGSWKLISAAIFSVTAKATEGTKCIGSTAK